MQLHKVTPIMIEHLSKYSHNVLVVYKDYKNIKNFCECKNISWRKLDYMSI